DGIRDATVTGVQTCALPIYWGVGSGTWRCAPRLRPAPRGTTPHSRRRDVATDVPCASYLRIRRRRGGAVGLRDLERLPAARGHRSEERRVGKEWDSRR